MLLKHFEEGAAIQFETQITSHAIKEESKRISDYTYPWNATIAKYRTPETSVATDDRL